MNWPYGKIKPFQMVYFPNFENWQHLPFLIRISSTTRVNIFQFFFYNDSSLLVRKSLKTLTKLGVGNSMQAVITVTKTTNGCLLGSFLASFSNSITNVSAHNWKYYFPIFNNLVQCIQFIYNHKSRCYNQTGD